MLAETSHQDYKPDFPAMADQKSIETLEGVIRKNIPKFGNAFKPKKQNEVYLNSKIINYFNRLGSPFIFEKDVAKRNTKRNEDIGVYFKDSSEIDDTPFYVIEAKRLPTPKSKKRNQQEYIIGFNNDGGVERFKKSLHGAKLKRSGMIGYIEQGTFDEWFKNINTWVEDLSKTNLDVSIIWNKKESLKELKINANVAFCVSKHAIKLTKNKIELAHFWIKLNL